MQTAATSARRGPGRRGWGRLGPAGALALTAPLLMAPAPNGGPQTADTAEVREQTIHLLQRATFGPRPEDIDHALALGLEGWLDAQMEPAPEPDSALDRRLARHPGAAMSPAESWAAFTRPEGAEALALLRERRRSGEPLSAEEQERLRAAAASGPGRLVLDLQAARLLRAVHSTRPLEEMMVGFWMDHFNVFVGKGQVRYQVADYEAHAIRPHVFGRFEDMLQSVASHPAMLLYLDNARSVAPDTTRLRRPRGPQARPLPGINENYARELLELHTLGVDGGYSEADVLQVARVFTGWSVVPPVRPGAIPDRGPTRRALLPRGEPWSFVFRPELHDRGPKAVLGWTLQGQGEAEGRELLARLSRHPSTAHTVATALATRFVADRPPESLIRTLESVFLETGGDLGAVTRALFLSPEFHDPAVRGGRIRSPFLLAAGALRLTGMEVVDPRGILEHLRAMGEVPYGAEAPTGFPEESAGWASSGAMVARIAFLSSLAAGEVRGVRIPPGSPLRTLGADPGDELRRLLLPGVASVPSRDSAPAPSPGGDAPRDVLALVLASPAFQTH